MEYTVQWTIDVDAESPREAAEQALTIQRDPNSIALIYRVTEMGDALQVPTYVDLTEDPA
jgi:hypothetical protein